MLIGDLLATVLSVRIVVVHVFTHGARAIQRHEGGYVVKAGGRQTTHQGTHVGRLELEQANRLAATKHGEHVLIIDGHVVNIDAFAGAALDEV